MVDLVLIHKKDILRGDDNMFKKKNKFNIGDKVVNKVYKRGSYEPSTLNPWNVVIVEAFEQQGDTYLYTCGYDGYQFLENELMSVQEYATSFVKRSR